MSEDPIGNTDENKLEAVNEIDETPEQKEPEEQKAPEELKAPKEQKAPKGLREKKKRSPFSYAIEFAIYILVIIACVFWVPEYVVQRTVVNGESMENTLHTGESLLVEKVSYHFSDPDRYDIIVFYPYGKVEGEEDEFYVKRIYGLPGETVQVKENQIYINGEVIPDEYAKNAMDDAGIAAEPLTLGKDEYFVLGDNRKVSLDSRDPDLGPIKAKNIVGHVFLRILPFDKFGTP